LIKKRDECEYKLSELTAQVNEIRSSRAQQQPLVASLRQETSQLATGLRDMKKQQTDLAQDMDSLKQEKAKYSEKLHNNSFLANNIKQDCVRLSSRIVSDPAKLLETIQDMNASVKEDKKNVLMAERKSRELKSRMDAMSVVEASLEECRSLLVESDAARQRAKEGLSAHNALHDSYGRKKGVLRDLDIKEQV
jgi:chromosome segregation ATPase